MSLHSKEIKKLKRMSARIFTRHNEREFKVMPVMTLPLAFQRGRHGGKTSEESSFALDGMINPSIIWYCIMYK